MLEPGDLTPPLTPSDTLQRRIDLSGLSKKPFIDEITQNKDRYAELVSLTPEEKAKAVACPIQVVGFENCQYVNGEEIQAILMKLLPPHLLGQYQHTRILCYDNNPVRPILKQGKIINQEISPQDAEGNYLRVMAMKVRGKPLMKIYSPVGMSQDNDVLKVAMIEAIVHDLGHGVLDYFFDQAFNGSEAETTTALDWINKKIIPVALGEGRALSTQSQAYEDMDEIFFQEELAEMMRMYVFERKRFEEMNLGTASEPNYEKFRFVQAMFEKGSYKEIPVFDK